MAFKDPLASFFKDENYGLSYLRELARSVSTSSSISGDTAPALGGNLDTLSYTISSSTGNVEIADSLHTTGSITSDTNQTDYQMVLTPKDVFLTTGGTWTLTRNGANDYSYNHTAAADSSILSFNVKPHLRTTTNKGYSLTSMDVVYSLTTVALNSHSIALNKNTYANNASITQTSVPLTGSLTTVANGSLNPYVTNITVTTPGFNNTSDSEYTLELTINAQALSTYRFYRIFLNYSANYL